MEIQEGQERAELRIKKNKRSPAVVAHDFNPRSRETEAGGPL